MEIENMLNAIEETLSAYVLRVGPLAGKLPDGRTVREFMQQELRNHCDFYDGELFSACLSAGVSYFYSHVCEDNWLESFFFDR